MEFGIAKLRYYAQKKDVFQTPTSVVAMYAPHMNGYTPGPISLAFWAGADRLEVGTTFHSTTFQSNKINSNERAQCACLCGARISIQDRKGVRSQGHIQDFKFGGGGGGGGGGKRAPFDSREHAVRYASGVRI